MKNIKNLAIILFCIITGAIQAQKIQLKTLNNDEVSRLKANKKSLQIIVFKDNSNNKTKVSKTNDSSEKDKIEATGQPDGKNCTPAKVTYKITSDKLTPVSPEIGIKLGNVYDINKFRQGNYSTEQYIFANDGLITVGGASTTNQKVTKVEKNSSLIDFQIALHNFTSSVNSNFMTQRMEQNFKMVFATSASQLNAKLGIGYSDKLGNEANVNSQLDLSSAKKKYTLIYKEENYYEELDMLGAKLMDNNSNPNLVYVSKIIYGKLGFFEYQSSQDFMKFGLQANGKYNYAGATLSADVNVSTMRSDTEGEITAKLFGSKSDSKIPLDKDAFINWINEKPTTDAVVPVGFILKFVNDNATAYFVTSGTDPIQICAPKPNADRKYDVKIELQNIKCNQICELPLDSKEDLWGWQGVTYAETKNNGQKVEKLTKDAILWEKTETNADKNGIGKGEKINISKSVEIKNLNEEEVKNLEIWIGGKINDWEPNRKVEYNCKDCNEPQNNPFKRVFKIKTNNKRITEIDQLIPNEDYKPLTVGDDSNMELNYEEGVDICKSKITSNYTIYVKTY